MKGANWMYRSVCVGVAVCAGLSGCGDDGGAEGVREPVPLADEDKIYGWVEDVTDFGVRSSGTEASRKTAHFVRDKFREFGLSDVAIEETPTVAWRADNWGLEVEGEEIPSQFMQHTFHQGEPASFSTGDGIEGELVYVGDGRRANFNSVDVEGKIVVANVRFQKYPLAAVELLGAEVYDPNMTFDSDFSLVDPYSRVTFPTNYYLAQEGGAVGFIGVLVDYIDSNGYHNEAYESYKTFEPGLAMEIPGLWLSPSEGAALADRIDTHDGPLMATMALEGELSDATGWSVIGYVRGQSDETILVQSHHDSTTLGAVEDATGTAEVLALAEYYAAQPLEERERTLMFASMDTHFTDYAAHKAFVKKYIDKGDILICLTVEHIARDVEQTDDGIEVLDRPAARVVMVSDEVEGVNAIVKQAIENNDVTRSFIVPTSIFMGEGLPADSSFFFTAGLPVVALVGSPIYLYDSIDTLDKVAKDDLPRVASAFSEMIDALDELPSDNFVRLPRTDE